MKYLYGHGQAKTCFGTKWFLCEISDRVEKQKRETLMIMTVPLCFLTRFEEMFTPLSMLVIIQLLGTCSFDTSYASVHEWFKEWIWRALNLPMEFRRSFQTNWPISGVQQQLYYVVCTEGPEEVIRNPILLHVSVWVRVRMQHAQIPFYHNPISIVNYSVFTSDENNDLNFEFERQNSKSIFIRTEPPNSCNFIISFSVINSINRKQRRGEVCEKKRSRIIKMGGDEKRINMYKFKFIG